MSSASDFSGAITDETAVAVLCSLTEPRLRFVSCARFGGGTSRSRSKKTRHVTYNPPTLLSCVLSIALVLYVPYEILLASSGASSVTQLVFLSRFPSFDLKRPRSWKTLAPYRPPETRFYL